MAQADRTLAVSSYIAEKLTPFVAPDRLQVVPNFIDPAHLARLVETPPQLPAAREPYLLFVGKFEENKGVRLLLDVLRQARPALPTLAVGDGSLLGELDAAVAEGLKLQVVGWQENAEVLRLMHQAEALLFPSLWPEPLSRVLLEAQGVGALTVAINTGGTADIIQSGHNGLLASSATEMAEQLTTILKPEQTVKRAELKANAREVARQRFSQTVVVDQVEAIYRSLV